MIRWVLGVAGVLLALFGVFRLLTQIPAGNLLALVVWLVAALVLHDGVLAPLTGGIGVVIGRVPRRLRRYLQGGLVASALIAVIALPLVIRRGTQPPEKALLEQNYAANLGILVDVVAAGVLALYLARVVRDYRVSAAQVRPAEHQHT